MSATKIAASLRVSLTALAPKQADSQAAVAFAWLRFHAALRMTWKQRAHPCVSTGRSIHAELELITHSDVRRRAQRTLRFRVRRAQTTPAGPLGGARAGPPRLQSGLRRFRSTIVAPDPIRHG